MTLKLSVFNLLSAVLSIYSHTTYGYKGFTQRMSDNKQHNKTPIKHCLVTGGAGFLGSNIAKALLKKGCSVVVFDIEPPKFSDDNMTYVVGDLRDEAMLNDAMKGVDTVFHTAAIICLLGGSAVTDSYRQRAYDINVKGTKILVDACCKNQVSRLIYTSSNNVTFNGTPIHSMDQSTPYATRVYDLYTETKIAAERYVLSQNGQNGLLTCAIRPGGIYGAESNYMLDTLVEQLKSGKVVAIIGDTNSVQDLSFIDNLVHGEILAAEALYSGSPACGKAYFITDDQPINNFVFFKPIFEALGYRLPKIQAPVWLLMPITRVLQWLHFTLKFPEPFLCPKEIDKAGITHFSSTKDARRDLGYEPIKTIEEATAACIPYCQQLLDSMKAR